MSQGPSCLGCGLPVNVGGLELPEGIECWHQGCLYAAEPEDVNPHRDDVLNYEHFDCCGQGMVPKRT
jgi:hypothetical protein